MKRLKINTITGPDKQSAFVAEKQYTVSLGNGYNGYFPSQKIALAFVAETNRDLNAKMYELNFLFSDVLKTYRASWIYFEKNGNIEHYCAEKSHYIERSFNFLVDRSHYENGNHLVFSHFHSIIENLIDICNALQAVYTKRGLTGHIYETNGFMARASHIKTAVVIYPRKIETVTEKHQHKSILKAV